MKSNRKKYLKKILILAGGIVILFLLIYVFLIKKNSVEKNRELNNKIENKSEGNIINSNLTTPVRIENDIDSIFTSFGILKEWIETYNPQDKNKDKSSKDKQEITKALWFRKKIEIPKDLSTIEVNYDLTNYFKERNFLVSVEEDIKTKDIEMYVYKIADTSKSQAIILVSIKHNEKIQRTSGFVSLVVTKLYDLKDEQISEIIQNENNYSYLMPYNLDHTDIINKLVHNKKEVVLELNVNETENIESEFRAGMSQNEINKKVKELQSDFPNVKNVILKNNIKTGYDKQLIENIIKELERYHIKAFKDSLFITTNINNSNELVNLIREKTNQKKFLCIIINFNYDELIKFREESLILKKKGFKFHILSELMNLEIEKEKKEKESQEKKTEEKLKQIEKKDKKKEIKVKKK